MPRLQINFSGPEHGWLGIKIQAECGEISVNASHSPDDTLTEFAEALVTILESGSSRPIHINEELQRSVLRFERDGDHLFVLHTCPESPHMELHAPLKAPFRSATREIARKLKLLYEEMGYDGFAKHWSHRPPKALIQRAWSRFAKSD